MSNICTALFTRPHSGNNRAKTEHAARPIRYDLRNSSAMRTRLKSVSLLWGRLAVRSAILATAWLLVFFRFCFRWE